MSVKPASVSPTKDPRVRIANHGPRNWRTEVQDEPGAAWDITGPPYATRAEALSYVDETVARCFEVPTEHAIGLRALQAQVEELTAKKARLEKELSRAKDAAAAARVDGDRKEQRALALLPDCEAHRRELHYLRHLASWNWHTMNDAEEARHAIVGALGNAVRSLQDRPDYTVSAAELCTWLEKAIDKQDKPLRRKSYPTLADCLRSPAGTCEHEGLSDALVDDIAKGIGLGDAYEVAVQRAGDDHLSGNPHPAHLCPYA